MAAKKKTLEESFTEIEQLLEQLEQEPVSLEQSFLLYKKGMDLVKKCTKTIDEVEKKVLILNEEGETDEF